MRETIYKKNLKVSVIQEKIESYDIKQSWENM